ncbi:PDZ domain-containing protein [Thermogymnomonas acidicola]|uniref:M61 family metallopeptidase n=1 Tax=Thermogymnomonas acidicola TaxID=399579 RepID=UPI000946866E|nr:PDZ domain-containing protein [Thermogymnomonas acidicola]
MRISYTVSMEKPQTHFFRVRIDVREVSDDHLDFTMPVWAPPGSYLVRDFSRHVRSFRAVSTSDGRSLEVQRLDKSTWRVRTGMSREVSVEYEVYANEFTVDTSHLDASHGYFNGTSVLMYIEGYKDQSCELVIVPYGGDWTVSTSLERIGGENRFRAPSYDILADSPVEIGKHRVLSFTVQGGKPPHEIVIYGHGNEDEKRLVEDIGKIVEAFASMFGQLPYRKYTFIFHLVSPEVGSGGLEHLSSTTIDIDMFTFRPREKYIRFLSVVAHEFFHLWNVKRIRPSELGGPFNYKQENYTNFLWIAEGFTNYYSYVALYRAGIISEKEYFEHIMESIRIHELLPGSRRVSAYESSFDAWIKLYKPTPNNYNSYISYYLKGEILGLILSIWIADVTNGQKSLDDLFRQLFEKYKKDGKGYGGEKEILNTIQDVTNHDFTDFFRRYASNPGPIDFDSELAKIGVRIIRKYEKLGGTDEVERGGYLGLVVRDAGGKYIVDGGVLEGTPAYEAGINEGDELVAINGYRFTDRLLRPLRKENGKLKTDYLVDTRPGETVSVSVFRRDTLLTIDVTAATAPSRHLRARNK